MRHEPDDEATFAADDKLETIRRQLDVEFGSQIGRSAVEPARKRPSSGVVRWVTTVVAGVLVGGLAAILATAVYLKIAESPQPAGRSETAPISGAAASGSPDQPTVSGAPAVPRASVSAALSSAPTETAPGPAAGLVTTNTPSLGSSRPVIPPPPPPNESLRSPPLSAPPGPGPALPSPTATVRNTPVPATPDSSRLPDAGGAGRASSSLPPPTPGAEPTRFALRPVPPLSPGSDARIAGAGVGMTRYSDPYGRFGIEYPVGWRVRITAAGTKGTTFYLDDPDEGIAVRVLPQGALQGNLNAAALAPILSQQIRQSYPDFRITALSTRPLAAGGEQSEFSAVWTNRWAQRMRATGVIVSAARGAETTYLYMAAQAQEFVFPGLETILQRVMYSLRPVPQG